MRKLFQYAILFASVALLVACNSEKKEDVRNQYYDVTEQYVKEELGIQNLDSVVILKIDTVDSYEYAQIMVNLLHQMDEEALSAYQSVLLSGDTIAARDLDIQIDEIAAAGEQWDMEVEATEGAAKTTRFYLITANYYAASQVDQFYFFITPDGKIHVPDPFAEL